MKILIISSTVLQSNSVGKIATELNAYLNKNGNETRLLYLDQTQSCDYVKIKPYWLYTLYFQVSRRSKYTFIKSPYTIGRIRKEINSFKPDIIQIIQPLPRLVDNEGLFKLLGKTNIPCVYTMIDENAYLGDCDNAYECVQFKKGCQYCKGQNYEINKEDYAGFWTAKGCQNIANSKRKGYSAINKICFVAPQWVIERADESQLLRGRKFYAVDEYVNNETVFYPQPMNKKEISKLGIDSSKILILNVARYTNTRKGVGYFLELARSLEEDERYQFINVGYDGQADLPQNFVGIPFVSNQLELAKIYTLVDLAMITSLSDTMPNTCLEALSCGTPVCGFDITGIPYVADYPMGHFVEPRNIEQLKQVVLKTNKKSQDISEKCREYALRRYSPEVSGANMVKIYHEMMEEGQYF